MRSLFLLPFLFFSIIATAQVGIGTTTPSANAALDIRDTARGILIPRLTLSQRTAIANPSEGLMVYQTNGDKGFWYFDGAQWVKSGSQSSSGGGKTILILEDTITDAQAQVKILAEVGPNTQMIRIIGCTNLTTLDLSNITTAAGIMINDNPALKNVNLGNLVSCYGNFEIRDCPQLSIVNLNSLKGVYISQTTEDWEFKIQKTGLATLNLPKFKKCLGDFLIIDNSSLSSISCTTLTNVDYFQINNNPLLISIEVSSLTSANSISVSYNNTLGSILFPSLSTLSYFYIGYNTNLSSISIPNLTQFGSLTSGNFQASNNKLPSSNINTILQKLVSISPLITGKSIYLSGQLPPAPPMGQGIIDKNTLIANGNTVTTD